MRKDKQYVIYMKKGVWTKRAVSGVLHKLRYFNVKSLTKGTRTVITAII